MSIPIGSLVADRFEIERVIGRGGMGTVFRARDRFTDEWVALKIPNEVADGSPSWERFDREARLLSELQHPGIVAYRGHGQTALGQRYIAMEWLAGEPLSSRLAARGLSAGESLTCIRVAATALQAAHERGIIHRDLKPSNLWLRDGRVDRTVLLDFGIARPGGMIDLLTQTGAIIGTPGYMAPEQARGERELRPSADIFSLGCVLFQCLTGRPPFVAEHAVAVLAKILCEEAPALRIVRPELPVELEALLQKALAKDPAERLPDALALATAIDEVLSAHDTGLGHTAPEGKKEDPATLEGEQQLLCVLLLEPPQPEAAELATVELITSDVQAPVRRAFRVEEILQSFGARGDWLMTGELVVTLSGLHDAGDLVTQAARCALALAKAMIGARIVVATGRGQTKARLPVGEVIDRAASLLRGHFTPTSEESERPGESVSQICVDELTARLLARRFTLTAKSAGFLLSGEETLDEANPFLGQPTPCVGREAELGTLEAQWRTCVDESEARAVLVTAPPGLGKSRLRQEFLRRLRSRGEPATVIEGRAESTTAGSPFEILARGLRHLCKIRGTESPTEKQEQVSARLGKHLKGKEGQRIVYFTGEFMGVSFPDALDPALAAARQDPERMRRHLYQSFIGLLRAEGAVEPVLLILEDLHWADALSLKLIDELLEQLADVPLLILALARPEIHEQYPTLWQRRQLQTMVLKALNKKACERLIRQTLGAEAPRGLVERLCQQSGGNALFLEELLRAAAQGAEDQRADTVIAMLQARFLRLSLATRRVMRAASIFGNTFWTRGVAAVLASTPQSLDLEAAFSALLAAEIIEKHDESRLPQEEEFGFHHNLMREAAYELLLSEDRRDAHFRAGEYLRAAGESDPLPIAEQFERGGAPELAAPLFVGRAERNLKHGDYGGALAVAARAHRCGCLQGEALGRLLAIEATAYSQTLDRDAQAAKSREALALLRPNSEEYCAVADVLIAAEGARGNHTAVEEWVTPVLQMVPDSTAQSRYLSLVRGILYFVLSSGKYDLARQLFEHLEHLGKSVEKDSASWPYLQLGIMRGMYLRSVAPDPWQQVEQFRFVYDGVINLGDSWLMALVSDFLGEAQGELGDFAGGEATLRASLARARASRQEYYVLHAQLHLAGLLVLAQNPAGWQEALEIARSALSASKLSLSYREWSHGLAARALLLLGEPESALEETEKALALPVLGPLRRLWIQVTRILALLRLKHPQEAAAQAQVCLDTRQRLGSAGYVEIQLRLAAAEALFAIGQDADARAQLVAADDEIHRQVNKIPDAEAAQRLKMIIPEHARVFSLLSNAVK